MALRMACTSAGGISDVRYLSVCSGIEAASVAWEQLGFVPVGFSEIEPFPCSVLAHRFPHVPNLGDMTQFKEWPIAKRSIDILVGGTPCQSFSIAGLRGGLSDDRGNLALTYCRILQKFRPQWFVWENVPGVFSSLSHAAPDPRPPENPVDMGREGTEVETEDDYESEEIHAFASILAGFQELGYGFAYRVLDAQFFGVPQRRRRVFVVGCAGDWRRAAQVLFEPGCLSGNSKKGRKSRQAVAALTATGVGTCGADDNQGQAGHLIPSITAHYGKGVDSDCTSPLVTHSLRGEGFDASEDGTGRGTPLVASPITSRPYGDRGAGECRIIPFDTTQITNKDNRSNPRAGDPCHPLPSHGHPPAIATSTGNRAHCLNAGGMGRQDYETETMVVAFSGRNRGDDGRGYDRPPNVTGDVCGTVDTVKPGNVAGPAIGVRRLTPKECERLQGFPDDWTLVPHGPKGKPAADGPRYKAIGNSMAVPVMHWIGKRIKDQSQ